jgi:hypothetical protein
MRVPAAISVFASIAVARVGAADLYKCETIQTYEARNIKKTCLGHQVSFACFALDKVTDWHCFDDAESAKSVDCTQVNTPDGHKYDGGCVYMRDYTFWGKLDGTNLATKAAHDLVKQFKDITGGFPSLLEEKALLGGAPVPPAGAANLYKCETIQTYEAKKVKKSCLGHQVSFACFALDRATDWHCFDDEKLARTVDCTKVNTPDGHKYDGGCVYMRDYTFWGKLDGTNLATKAAHDLAKQFKDITGGFR